MWNHNNHFHNYLLRQLPRKVNRVLDIGCGLGVFAQRLAERSELVEALDVDKAILEEASNLNSAPNICQNYSLWGLSGIKNRKIQLFWCRRHFSMSGFF